MKYLVALFTAWMIGTAAYAEDARWVEATGVAVINSAADTDAARRRAVADALYNAAMAGGAAVQGYTAVNMTRTVRDLAIVRPVGHVMRSEVLTAQMNGSMWQVRIRALVGTERLVTCKSAARLNVTAYRPDLRVSPYAPAWTGPLAMDIYQSLLGVLHNHPATGQFRVTDRELPGASRIPEGQSFVVLTRGSVALGPGDFGFVPEIILERANNGNADAIQMSLNMKLIGADGAVFQQRVQRQVNLAGPSLFESQRILGQSSRTEMARELTAGLTDELNLLLSQKACEPISANLTYAGETLRAPIGTRHGLSRGAIAFTADRSNSVEMLEIVNLSNSSVTVRPMDPTRSVQSFGGRPIRFIEAQF